MTHLRVAAALFLACACGSSGDGDGAPDAGPGSSQQTIDRSDPDVAACLSRGEESGEAPECSECVCTRCGAESAAVLSNEDAEFGALATAMLDCQRDNDCAGSACYCGPGVDPLACINRMDGPCKDEVEAAAGVSGAAEVQLACDADTGGTPCAAVRLLGRCILGDTTVLGNCPMCTSDP